MINRLCAALGKPLPTPFASSTELPQPHSFPPPEALAKPEVEPLLRELGFGYRAPYVHKTAVLLCELAAEANQTTDEYLESLAKLPYEEAREALLQFTGVGPKVADCIALFGLGFREVVPVDTHVWQIAVRDYKFKGGPKEAKGPVSKDIYEKVKTHLRKIWGDSAGWTQQVCIALCVISSR